MIVKEPVLITGGTGSFGKAVVDRLIELGVREIRIFSRDEKKQEDMRNQYASDYLKFYIGDVRDRVALSAPMSGVGSVFHAAALKQVPSCEFYPMEAIKTNVLGADNVIDAAIEKGVSKVVILSTDKAVYPINAMGISKAMMEKVAIARSRECHDTVVCITRYGNVMASRGSVIPLFRQQLIQKKPLTITDPDMTRFMMSLREAVDLVLYAMTESSPGDVFVQKSPAADIKTIAKAVAELDGHTEFETKIIGTRHAEKLFEVLLSREEMAVAEDLGDYYRIPADNRSLNYAAYFSEGDKGITDSRDYNSAIAERLTRDQLVMKLKNELL